MIEKTTVSIDLADIPLALLIDRQQTLGSKIDKLRAERAHIKSHIEKRLSAGESEHASTDADQGDALAPGAFIEAAAT